MKNNVENFLLCFLMLAVASCATTAGRHERLEGRGIFMSEIIASMIKEQPDFRYEGPWRHAHSHEEKGLYAIDEFVSKNETIDNWTKLVTVQNFAKKTASPADPKSMMIGLRQSMEQRCPGVVWNIIRERDDDILYEYHLIECAGHPDQHEIARILYGRWNIWRIAYTQKGPPMGEQERLKWVEALSEPSIVVW